MYVCTFVTVCNNTYIPYKNTYIIYKISLNYFNPHVNPIRYLIAYINICN